MSYYNVTHMYLPNKRFSLHFTSLHFTSLHVSKQNRICIIPADTVVEFTGRDSIPCVWKNRYANLFNCVDSASDKESVLDTISRVSNVHDTLCSDDVKSSVNSLSANKACGLDNIFAEHLLYASPSVQPLLSICFNAVIVHGCLPSDLTDTVLVPIVKEKTGDISDKGNYRNIALASVVSKCHCLPSLKSICIHLIISLDLNPEGGNLILQITVFVGLCND